MVVMQGISAQGAAGMQLPTGSVQVAAAQAARLMPHSGIGNTVQPACERHCAAGTTHDSTDANSAEAADSAVPGPSAQQHSRCDSGAQVHVVSLPASAALHGAHLTFPPGSSRQQAVPAQHNLAPGAALGLDQAFMDPALLQRLNIQVQWV